MLLNEEFANVQTPDGLLAFVVRHGPLYLSRQDVLPLLKQAKQMRQCMRGGTIGPYGRHAGAAVQGSRDRQIGNINNPFVAARCVVAAISTFAIERC